MTLFGLTISREKAPVGVTHMPTEVVNAHRGWTGLFGGGFFGTVHEAFAGAWQRNIVYSNESILTQSTVWACVTLIMQDIGKLGVELIEDQNGIWVPTTNTAYSPVLRRPNHYQGWIKFIESWICSKITRGNAYILKERDNRGGPGQGNVIALYVLDPTRVEVLVAPDGGVYYNLAVDNLAGLTQDVQVPASEIIHDVHLHVHHHLCGLSPLVACALAASQSLAIQHGAARFFANNSRPGGILTAPRAISEENAKRIREHWQANYAGDSNVGKVAVVGDGMTFAPMAQTAVESDLAKQLGWTDEKICAVFHIPPFMVGVGPMPTYDNIAKLNQQYYQQALQELIECVEECLDWGLGLPPHLYIRINIDNLLRMDQQTLIETLDKGRNYYKPNEGRFRLNLPPVMGGDTVYRQQQDFSLEALSKRDAKADPFAKDKPAPAPAAAAAVPIDDETAKAVHVLQFRTRAKAMAERYMRGGDVERTG